MGDEPVGDRTDDRAGAFAEPRIEDVLEPDDVRGAVRVGLVVHPVVGRQRDRGAERVEPPEHRVHVPVVAVSLRLAGRVLVLDVVGQREVEHVRLAPLQQPDPRLEHEERELGRVHVGQRHADELEHVLDAVLLERTLLRALRGEVDAATREVHVLAELPAQLVLRRDGHDTGAVA